MTSFTNSILLKIVYIADIAIPITSILCSCMLLWTIKTVKTKHLIHINYSMVPNSFIDIFMAAISFIVAPHVFYTLEKFYIFFGDLFGFFDYYTACYFAAAFGGMAITSMLSITVSYYIRFLVICKNQKLSIKTMIAPYLILFVIFIILYILFFWHFLLGFENYKNAKATKPNMLTLIWIDEYGRFPLFVGDKIMSIPFFVGSGFILLLFITAGMLVFYYSSQISKTLKTHITHNNSAAKLLHQQIQRTLAIQAIGPFLMGSLPIFLIIIKNALQLKMTELSLILSFFFPWISISNSIAAFIFIKPYRSYIKRMFDKILKPFQRNTNISMVLPASK